MKNYFAIFNLPTDFIIDKNLLEQKFLQLQQQFHPDQNNVEAIDFSIILNNAYATLNDDFLRAQYLLLLKNIDIDDDENIIKPEQSTLEYILQLQEDIACCYDLSKLNILYQDIHHQITDLLENFSKYYFNNDLNFATQLLIKAKYLTKSLNDIKNRKNKIKNPS